MYKIKTINNDPVLAWFAPFGQAVKLSAETFTPQSLRNLNRAEFRSNLRWMGIESLPLVGLSAVFVSLALTIQTVIELQKYSAQDISGAVISIGLLRELGPLTVSLAWCARVAARLSSEARQYSGDGFASQFVLPKYLAALSMAIPLGAYGLVIGFLTSAFFAPLIGVSSTNDYLEAARISIKDKDLFVYFTKLILINPTIAVFAGCVIGRSNQAASSAASNAVTAMFITAFFANLLFTYAVYMP